VARAARRYNFLLRTKAQFSRSMAGGAAIRRIFVRFVFRHPRVRDVAPPGVRAASRGVGDRCRR